MGARSVLVAAGCSLLTGAGAVACFLKTSQLRTEAGWLMARADAQAAEYSSTLDSAIAETQLATLELHRAVLQRAYTWQRLEMLLILAAVVSAFCAYFLHLYHRLRQQLDEAEVSSNPSQR
jgi:hypothetical protein